MELTLETVEVYSPIKIGIILQKTTLVTALPAGYLLVGYPKQDIN